MEPDRVLVDLADPEHPAVPLAAPHRPADLVGERLIGDLLVGLSHALAIDPFGPRPDRRPERGDRLLEAPLHQVMKPWNGITPPVREVGRILEPIAIDGVKEHRRPDPLVEVPRILAKRLELVARPEDLDGGEPARRSGSSGLGASGRGG